MSNLKYFDYEGFGEHARDNTHYHQAVRVGDKIVISGQGGWVRETSEILSDPLAEIDMAFANVEHAVRQAGGTGFDQVYLVRVYLTKYAEDEEARGARVVENLRKYFTKHMPLMTVLGVERLYSTMTVEIEAEAYVG